MFMNLCMRRSIGVGTSTFERIICIQEYHIQAVRTIGNRTIYSRSSYHPNSNGSIDQS